VIQVFVSSLAAAQTDLDLRHGDCVLALSTQPWCRRQFVLGDTLRRDLVTNPVFIGLRSNSPHAHSHHMVPGRAEENYSSPFPLPDSGSSEPTPKQRWEALMSSRRSSQFRR
jgi:hypothetical protein